MIVSFDKLFPGSAHVLGRSQVKRFVEAITPPEILQRITRLHFGCNRRTTQEARIVGRGATLTIRVNFWLENSQSRLVSDSPSWLSAVQSFGGIVEAGPCVRWPNGRAAHYGAFLLAHEIAHVLYWQQRGHDRFPSRTGSAEEEWCDSWAREAVRVHAGILGTDD